MVDGAPFPDHEAHARLDPATVIVRHLGKQPAVHAERPLHAGHHEAALQDHALEDEGLKQAREIRS
jgi:hypothetical protein